MYLQSIVHFRALAILLIVASHSYDVAGIPYGGFQNAVLRNLVTGGTTFFVFISGYMFHHAFYHRFDFPKFFLAKIRFVLVPYLSISIVYLSWLMASDAVLLLKPFSVSQGDGFVDYIRFFVQVIFYGKAFWAFWYIPFVMLLYSFAQFHFRYLGISKSKQLVIFLVATLIALVVQRPPLNLTAFHSLVSFTPAYLLGMLCSQNRSKILSLSNMLMPATLFLGLSTLLLQTQSGHIGNYEKSQIFALRGVDLMLLQKLFLSVGMFLVFEKFRAFEAKLIGWISATSFTVFFLHQWVKDAIHSFDLNLSTHIPWVDLALWTILITTICSIIASVGKTLLHKNSRYFLGY
jgi:hypothetical protein